MGNREKNYSHVYFSRALFHIDFGKFLGNAQMFLAFKRDRAPFVFTPDMAYVMGGTDTEEFKLFKDLCCKAYNILRKNAQVFISLFAMVKKYVFCFTYSF